MIKKRRSNTFSNARGSFWALWKKRGFQHIIIVILVISALVFTAQKAVEVLFESPYFRIKTIEIDRALSFIDKRHLNVLKGKSVFTVDLKRLEQDLRTQYPQISQIKIIKKFPSRILIVAKKRLAFAQASIQAGTVLIDDQGVILSVGSPVDKQLPLILGVTHHKRITPGVSLGGEDTLAALNIIKEFEDNNTHHLPYHLTKVDVANRWDIVFYLSNNLKIIVDKNDIGRKMDLLALVLSENQLTRENVKYIDLRFKEPILGTK